MIELDLAGIKARAEAATPGGWVRLHDDGNPSHSFTGLPATKASPSCSCGQVWSELCDWPIAFCDTSEAGEGPSPQLRMANAAHIAGLSPDVALALVAEVERLREEADQRQEAMASAYQAVGSLVYHFGIFNNPDCIRLLDVLAYGKTQDGKELLPWPHEPLPNEEAALRADRDEAVSALSRLSGFA